MNKLEVGKRDYKCFGCDVVYSSMDCRFMGEEEYFARTGGSRPPIQTCRDLDCIVAYASHMTKGLRKKDFHEMVRQVCESVGVKWEEVIWDGEDYYLRDD